MKTYKRRLLKAADIVEKVPPEEFDMREVTHKCGTPACILGHYAFAIGKDPGEFTYFESDIHFGINDAEWIELFNSNGCGFAKTGKEAAKYIRKFVERKYG